MLGWRLPNTPSKYLMCLAIGACAGLSYPQSYPPTASLNGFKVPVGAETLIAGTLVYGVRAALA